MKPQCSRTWLPALVMALALGHPGLSFAQGASNAMRNHPSARIEILLISDSTRLREPLVRLDETSGIIVLREADASPETLAKLLVTLNVARRNVDPSRANGAVVRMRTPPATAPVRELTTRDRERYDRYLERLRTAPVAAHPEFGSVRTLRLNMSVRRPQPPRAEPRRRGGGTP